MTVAAPENASTEQPWLRPPPTIFFDFIFLEKGVDAAAADFDLFAYYVAQATKADQWQRTCPNDAYEKLLCIKAAGGIPLIFAQGVDAAQADAQIALNQIAILAPVLYTDAKDGYPINAASEIVGGAGRLKSPTPATLLYLSWRIDNRDACPAFEPSGDSRASAERARAIVAAFRERVKNPISILWGSGLPDQFVALERSLYNHEPGLVRTGYFLDETLQSSVSRPGAPTPPPSSTWMSSPS